MSIIYAQSEHLLVLDNDIFNCLRSGDTTIKQRTYNYVLTLSVFPALPSITIFEALKGIESSLKNNKITEQEAKEYKDKINKFIKQHPVLPVDEKAAEIAAYIVAKIGHSKANQHWCDIFIAATALANKHGVATKNKKDFEEISNYLPDTYPDLILAIWQPLVINKPKH